MPISIRRLLAGLIDYAIICGISEWNIKTIMFIFSESLNENLRWMFLYLTFVFILFCIKDCVFKNASIGKKLLHIQVISLENEKITIFTHAKRMLPILLWPIEMILLFVNNRRLGDFWAKTIVKEIG